MTSQAYGGEAEARRLRRFSEVVQERPVIHCTCEFHDEPYGCHHEPHPLPDDEVEA